MQTGLQAFADRIGRFFADHGLPPAAGRIFGHLLTCDPPEQTFDEVVTATGQSRSTVSVATRLLVQVGLAERFGLAGDRRDRYRLRPDAWTMLLKQDLAAATRLKLLADEGLGLLARQPPALRARLRAMKEFYGFLEEAHLPLVAAWEKRTQRGRRS